MTPTPTSSNPTGSTTDDNDPKILNPANNLLTAHQVNRYLGKFSLQTDINHIQTEAILPESADIQWHDATDDLEPCSPLAPDADVPQHNVKAPTPQHHQSPPDSLFGPPDTDMHGQHATESPTTTSPNANQPPLHNVMETSPRVPPDTAVPLHNVKENTPRVPPDTAVPRSACNTTAPNTVTGVAGVPPVGDARESSDNDADLNADKPTPPIGDARESSDDDADLNADKPILGDARESLDDNADLNADKPTHKDAYAMDSRDSPEPAPDAAHLPDDSPPKPIWPPPASELIKSIRRALAWNPRPRTMPIFDFRMSAAAAQANYEVLKQHDFDLDKIIRADLYSPLLPGSEFRFYTRLDPIFTGHPVYASVRRTMLLGARFPSRPVPDDVRLRDLQVTLDYGNHRSAIKEGPVVFNMLEKEVHRGWQLPLPIECLSEIPDVVVNPLGDAHQWTLDADGNRIPKHRVTHDLSSALGEGPSVNDRIDMSRLTPCRYGFALRRFIHLIVELRRRHPTTPILQCKFDFKSAYRRIHQAAQAAFQSTTTTKGLGNVELALVALRLTFGGRPCPAIFSEFSEMLTDLANVLLQCDDWDPANIRPTHSDLVGTPIMCGQDIPFAQARPTLVPVQVNDSGGADVYLDDVFSAVPALSTLHVERGYMSILLALEIIGRPVYGESLERDDLLAIAKAIAEGTPTEILIVTGWELDTRRLRVCLTETKLVGWFEDLQSLIDLRSKPVRYDPLKTLVGRLEHVAAVFTPAKHFLSRLRYAKSRAETHRVTRLSSQEQVDLRLWQTFLHKVRNGIDMNLLTYREPNRFSRTDACEYGLGGYSRKSGRAWRWPIQPGDQGRYSINFLEFLASVIGFHLELTDAKPGDCFLCETDSSTAESWLDKSNFQDEDYEHHLELARGLAEKLMEYDVCLYSQYLPGPKNNIADLNSREQTASNEALTHHILCKYPFQVPPNFRISPLPPEITSFVTRWLQPGPRLMVSPATPEPKLIPIGATGLSFSSRSNSTMTPSSPTSNPSTASEPLQPLPTLSGNATTVSLVKATTDWLRRHAAPPSTQWQRPSQPTASLTQRKDLTEKLRSFYADNSEGTRTTTRVPSTRSASP